MQFSQDELKDMHAFYEQELATTVERLKHIERILQKLGSKKFNVEVNVASPTSTSTKSPKTAPTRRKSNKKRGPKSIWGNFVLNKLKELDKPLTYDELIAEGMKFANVGKDKEVSIRQSIVNVTYRLRAKERKIDTFSNGTRIKFIALKTWFKDGEIDPAYAAKASDVKPEPSKKRKTAKKRATAKK